MLASTFVVITRRRAEVSEICQCRVSSQPVAVTFIQRRYLVAAVTQAVAVGGAARARNHMPSHLTEDPRPRP